MIETIDILVHPWWGLGYGFRYSERERLTGRGAGAVSPFVKKQDWNGEDQNKAYGNLLLWLWKRRITSLASEPTSALAIVWSNHVDIRDLEEELKECAEEQLQARVIHDALLESPPIFHQKVKDYFQPQNGVTLRAYGELSYACVRSVLYATMAHLRTREMPVHSYAVIEKLCGDTLTGKREAYAQRRAEQKQQEAHP